MENWSDLPARTVGSVYGIPLRIDVTFLFAVLPILLSIVRHSYAHTSDYPIAFALMLGGVFLSILAHELGHALMARRYGLRAEEIRIGGFYGFAVLSGTAARRIEAILILLAGPAANALLFLLFWLLLGFPELSGQLYFSLSDREIPILDNPAVRRSVQWLALVNFGMSLFNLLPAFPLDGGRIARLMLGGFLSDTRSVRLVATLGILIGAWSCLGISSYPSLFFVGPLLILANAAVRSGDVAAPQD